jgi:hypothetical protein
VVAITPGTSTCRVPTPALRMSALDDHSHLQIRGGHVPSTPMTGLDDALSSANLKKFMFAF